MSYRGRHFAFCDLLELPIHSTALCLFPVTSSLLCCNTPPAPSPPPPPKLSQSTNPSSWFRQVTRGWGWEEGLGNKQEFSTEGTVPIKSYLLRHPPASLPPLPLLPPPPPHFSPSLKMSSWLQELSICLLAMT